MSETDPKHPGDPTEDQGVTPESSAPEDPNDLDPLEKELFFISDPEGNTIIIESSDPNPLRTDQPKPIDVNGKEINTGALVRFSRKGVDVLKLEQNPSFYQKGLKTIRTRVEFINSKGEVFINGEDVHGAFSTKVEPDWLVVE